MKKLDIPHTLKDLDWQMGSMPMNMVDGTDCLVMLADYTITGAIVIDGYFDPIGVEGDSEYHGCLFDDIIIGFVEIN